MTQTRSAIELAASIRNGETTATEVLEDHLARIDEQNPTLNAVCFRDDATARADAAEIDEKISAGKALGLGEFVGVPMLIKDLNDVEGWPTSYGSRAVSDDPAPSDELAVARLRAAGFVISGKTATPEFGTISMTESERFGITRNPWNTDHTPGGSSGGAAAAVAAGISPAAHASDGGGSIRIPASCTGLIGLKCARHRISARAAKMTGGSTQGVVTRTVADTAAITDVMAQLDPGAWEVAIPLERPLTQSLGVDPGKLRIKVAVESPMGVAVDDECVAAVEACIEMLEAHGHIIDRTPMELPDPGRMLDGFLTVWSTITAGTEVDPALLEPHNRANREMALATSAISYAEAAMDLQLMSREITAPFGRDFDMVLSPTMAVAPPPVGSLFDGASDDPMTPLFNATPMAAFTALYNITGQPAINLPVHIGANNLPIGVQLAAPPFGEAALIKIASQLEPSFPSNEISG